MDYPPKSFTNKLSRRCSDVKCQQNLTENHDFRWFIASATLGVIGRMDGKLEGKLDWFFLRGRICGISQKPSSSMHLKRIP